MPGKKNQLSLHVKSSYLWHYQTIHSLPPPCCPKVDYPWTFFPHFQLLLFQMYPSSIFILFTAVFYTLELKEWVERLFSPSFFFVIPRCFTVLSSLLIKEKTPGSVMGLSAPCFLKHLENSRESAKIITYYTGSSRYRITSRLNQTLTKLTQNTTSFILSFSPVEILFLSFLILLQHPKELSWTLLMQMCTSPQSLITIFYCFFDSHVKNKWGRWDIWKVH